MRAVKGHIAASQVKVFGEYQETGEWTGFLGLVECNFYFLRLGEARGQGVVSTNVDGCPLLFSETSTKTTRKIYLNSRFHAHSDVCKRVR